MKTKGFTLIELLVVISIIGLLASIALASLNVARTNAANAAIKQNLDTIRTQAQLYYSDNLNYGTAFFQTVPILGDVPDDCADAGVGTLFVQPQIQAAFKAAERANPGNSALCKSSASPAAWVVMMSLKQVSDEPISFLAWCVDSLGHSGQIEDAIQGGITQCPL